MTHHDLPTGHLKTCQLCQSEYLELIIDLGHHAPCDSLLTKAQLQESEKTYPLRFLRCKHCGLGQIDYVVDPAELFYPDYPYRSGITGTLVKNLQSIAEKCRDNYGLKAGGLAIDVGSNDGTLLQGFQSMGLNVIGVEPTKVAQLAIENGVPTVNEFFTHSVAVKIKEEHGAASVITATNMFAHIPNLGDMMRSVYELLEDDGIFVSESHYLLDLIETVQYDSIYHEHLKYYTLKTLIQLKEAYGFTVIGAERIPNYGGSIRVVARKGKGRPVSENIDKLLQLEAREIPLNSKTNNRFRERVVFVARYQAKRAAGCGCWVSWQIQHIAQLCGY